MPSGQVKREYRRVKRKCVGKADGFKSCPQDIPKLFTIIYSLERSEYAPLAQLVEQLTLNQWVPGSSP